MMILWMSKHTAY